MTQFKIESDIPLPPRKPLGGGTREAKYPFAQMEIGQSFAVPCERNRKKILSRINSATGVARKKLGLKFSVRSDGAAVRVWRTA